MVIAPRSRRAARLRAWAALLALVTGLPSAACAVFRTYDMADIHQESSLRQERNPVIVVHGFIGAKLKNNHTHESVWGRFINAVKRCKTDDLDLPIDQRPITENRDDLVAYDIYESVAGVKFYGALLEALRDVGGYRFGDIRNPRPEDTAFVYYYDWRRDNVESAIGLGRAIQQIKARLKRPEMRFDIVAHSMGGMVAQYYLRYGMQDVTAHGREPRVTWAGASQIGRMVLLGVPNRGTMQAFRVLNTGFSRTMSPEAMFTMPSVYQLLPFDGHGHFVDPQGALVEIDLYDAEAWVRNGWSVFNPRFQAQTRSALGVNGARPVVAGDETARLRSFLQAALHRARAFHAALEQPVDDAEPPVPVHLFGSDCMPTLDRVILKPTPAGVVTLFHEVAAADRDLNLVEKMVNAPGDGTVTANSLLGLARNETAGGTLRTNQPFASTYFFCESHGLLPTNRGFQDNLFHVLFRSPDRPSTALNQIRGR